MDQMNEEEAEFGMDKTSLRETDPMEQEARGAVKDHPDFRFLDAGEVRAAASSGDPLAVPTWMTIMPVDKDPSKWTILEVQVRPDRAWEIIKELIGTVCMSKGLLLAEENANSVLFRKKVAQESLARGMANSATYQNVFVRIGVSPSKLRVVHICTLVSGENKLLGGLVSTTRTVPWAQQQYVRTLNYALDQLLGALQATIIAQCLTLSHLYMSTPDNSMDAGWLVGWLVRRLLLSLPTETDRIVGEWQSKMLSWILVTCMTSSACSPGEFECCTIGWVARL